MEPGGSSDPRAPEIPYAPPTSSVNRVVIVDLPGLPIDAEVRGQQAYHLLSVPALIRYAQLDADALDLPQAFREGDPESAWLRRELPPWVDGRLSIADDGVRTAAQALARRLGRNLGYLLATLHRGDEVNRAARSEWTAAEWLHWHRVRRVWLGGGVVSGNLGDTMVRHARTVLEETNCAIAIDKTPYPRHMATLGAGRFMPRPTETATYQRGLVLDFGQTSVKRAILTYRGNDLVRVDQLPTQSVVWRWRNSPVAALELDPYEVLGLVAGTLCESLALSERVGLPVGPDVMVSIAAYVRGGELLGNGGYARMRQLAKDARPLIADRVSTTCGREVRIAIIHDGTAAAAVHAGEAEDGTQSAVIVVGTALGVGFPTASAKGLRGIAPDLVVGDAVGDMPQAPRASS